MKAWFFFILFALTGISTAVQAQSFDDVYGGMEQRYDSYSKKKKRQEQAQDYDNASSVDDNVNTTSQRSYMSDEEELNDFNQSQTDDFQYATRIRRFCTPMYSAGYFSRFYWDPYWWDWNYTYPSWYSGFNIGIYPSFGWANPSFGWGYNPWTWNSFYPGFGWGNMYNGWGCGFGGWGNFYGGYYGGWGGFYPGWGYGGGFNNYWNGFYDGYWSNNNYPNGNGYSYGPRRGLNSTSGMQNGRREYTPRDRSLAMDNMPNAYRGNTRLGGNTTNQINNDRRNNNTLRTQNPGYNPQAAPTRDTRNLNQYNNNDRFNRDRNNNINDSRNDDNRGGTRFNQTAPNNNTDRFQNNNNTDRFQNNRNDRSNDNMRRQQEVTPNAGGRTIQRESNYNTQQATPRIETPRQEAPRVSPPVRQSRSNYESAPSRSRSESTPRSSAPSSPRMSMPSAPSGGGGGSFRGGRR